MSAQCLLSSWLKPRPHFPSHIFFLVYHREIGYSHRVFHSERKVLADLLYYIETCLLRTQNQVLPVCLFYFFFFFYPIFHSFSWEFFERMLRLCKHQPTTHTRTQTACDILWAKSFEIRSLLFKWSVIRGFAWAKRIKCLC